MLAIPRFSDATDVQGPKAKLGTKARRRQRQMALESLESRVVLSYTFSYVGNIATALGSGGAVNSLVLEPLGGFLLHSVNGSPFDGNWGGVSVPVSPLLNVNVTLSTGDGSSIQLGTATAPASDFGSASLHVVAPLGNTADKTIIDDSHGTTLASGIHPYSIDTNPGFISGPGFNYAQNASFAFAGGITLLGSPVNGNVYNVLSVFGNEPVTLETAAGTTSTVNVGSGGTLAINSPLAIYDPGDATTININDAADTTNATATLDNLSGNPNAPFEVTGLSPAPIEYGAGVTALNINGGTSAGGAAGVTYNINNTQGGTTTTINAGPNPNAINLSDAATADLDNLAGPVVVHGSSSFANVVTLNDTNTPFADDYTLDDLSSAPGIPTRSHALHLAA